MCKIKDYTKQMEEMNSSIAFRFDFYSMPSFRNTFVELVKERLKIRDFTERLLTEEEKQTINIDALCSVLDNSIDEVVSKKVYKMICTTSEDDSLELYISPYFLFVIYSRTENKQIPWEIMQTITGLLVERKEDIDLQNTSCHVIYQKKTDKTTLWKIFDHEAFPTLDTGAMTVGRYADKHKYDDHNVTVELVRIIKIGQLQLPDDKVIDPYFYINIISISNSKRNAFLVNPGIENLYNMACKEATKCFK